MIFALESYAKILDDIKGIVPEFMAEVDIYPESPTPNLDHDQFIRIEESDALQVVTVRDNNELMGIHVATIIPDVFYQHILTAYVLWYYLKPESRGKGSGLTMFSFAETVMRNRGAKRIFMSRKIYMPNERLFKKLEFTHIESGYTKHLG